MEAQGTSAGQMVDQPVKLDKRVVKTRAAIHDAFRTLIRRENLGKITVSALAREAGIDRKTFYLHYDSVEALFDEEVEALVERILAAVDIEQVDADRAGQTEAALNEVNAIIMSDVDFFAYLAHTLSLEFSLDHIRHAVSTYMVKRYGVPEGAVGVEQLMHMLFMLAGAVAVYGEWLRGDHSQPIEEVSQVVFDILEAQ
jgi:AcrR family transcriptional regulator